jgi:GH25 family lysozyme M1 (1,4-beta-N-acetylmuramidase)
MTEKWIDVSAHNCRVPIDWPKVAASGVKGVVIRAGYGDSISQQDKCFKDNIEGAIAAGLKIAVYWFSYADSVADVLKEWDACKQVIEPYRKNIKFVAFDYEYASYNYYKKIHGTAPTKALINAMANAFLNAVKANGYGTMLYTNNDYRRNIFSTATLAVWDVWLADYTGTPDISCAIQQTGSTGHVDGITGNVDMDTVFKAYASAPQPAPVKTAAKPSNTTVNIYYRVRIGDRWLPEVRNLTDFAGLPGKAITDVAVRVSTGSVKYRVHVKGGAWLPYVTGCNINDRRSGYAGDGRPIDAVEIYYYTPASIRPVKRAKYRVAPVGGGYWPWQYDNDKTGGMDGYAGSFGRTIDHLQICIE